MKFDEYMDFTQETAIYPQAAKEVVRNAQVTTGVVLEQWLGLAYVTGKLNGEAGEIAEEVFKTMRDDKCNLSPERITRIRSELGDLLYYMASIASILGISLDAVAEENMTKLRSRKDRGVIQGSGSDR